jgi:hypothetical protein
MRHPAFAGHIMHRSTAGLAETRAGNAHSANWRIVQSTLGGPAAACLRAEIDPQPTMAGAS